MGNRTCFSWTSFRGRGDVAEGKCERLLKLDIVFLGIVVRRFNDDQYKKYFANNSVEAVIPFNFRLRNTCTAGGYLNILGNEIKQIFIHKFHHLIREI